ncbi:MAG: SurA N-terminal domain-containing protein [Pseudomonadota bacterium]
MGKGGIGKTFMWILMGLLILGLAGFAVTDLSGTVRSIGKVGQADISTTEYFSGLQSELNNRQQVTGERLNFLEAQQVGIPERVLSQLITRATLNNETISMGLSVGDEEVRDTILSQPQFNAGGSFNREAYRFALERQGLNEQQYEDTIRQDRARQLLEGSIFAGLRTPETFRTTMADFLGERRTIELSILQRSDLEVGIPIASEEQLAAFHAENADVYTRPEAKRITYAILRPDMVIDTVEVNDEELRLIYDANSSIFNQPARRLLERLVFSDRSEAEAAKARLDSGEITFEELVEERGLELSDIDQGVVTEEELGGIAADVFAGEALDIIGPFESTLGPALFRINAVLEPQTTSFEDALPQLRINAASDRAGEYVVEQIEIVDDLLAGGATVEDVAKETELEVNEIEFFAGARDPILASPGFVALAQQVTVDDFPEVEQLENGAIVTMQVEEVLPPALRPLETVRADVEAAWDNAQIQELLLERAEPDVEKLRNGASFEETELTLDATETITRRGNNVEQAPADLLETVFGMQEGAVEILTGGGRVFVLRLASVEEPNLEDPSLSQLLDIVDNQAATGIANDYFNVLITEFGRDTEISINDAALQAVHQQFQ